MFKLYIGNIFWLLLAGWSIYGACSKTNVFWNTLKHFEYVHLLAVDTQMDTKGNPRTAISIRVSHMWNSVLNLVFEILIEII